LSFNALSRLISVFMKLFYVFEPLMPSVIRWTVRKRIESWKNRGLVEDYKLKVRRLGKLHYRLEMEFVLGDTHVQRILRIAPFPADLKEKGA